jgi:MerR family transcriptional regulator, light-induced transcriptional regulator
MAPGDASLSIGDLAGATGIAVGTLRMWESRHGFPVARRRDGGHRRYDAAEVARVQRVIEARRQGMSLAVAIERVRDWTPGAPPSLFAVLREQQPELAAQRLPIAAMQAVSEAIEEECLARAGQPLLAGSFEHERAFRVAEARWRELARTAALAFVLADFARARSPRGGPAEVPVPAASPVRREWAVVCVGPELSACLAGWELPREHGERRFEAIWTTDGAAAAATLRVALAVAGGAVAARGTDLLDRMTLPGGGDAATAVAVANRALGHLAASGFRR